MITTNDDNDDNDYNDDNDNFSILSHFFSNDNDNEDDAVSDRELRILGNLCSKQSGF